MHEAMAKKKDEKQVQSSPMTPELKKEILVEYEESGDLKKIAKQIYSKHRIKWNELGYKSKDIVEWITCLVDGVKLKDIIKG